MKTFFKNTISIIIIVVILFSISVPAFASEERKDIMTRSGYDTKQIYINGVPYSATFSLGGSVSTGGRSIFSTNARCIRNHYAVSVTYSTASTGRETYSGGASTKNGTYDNTLGRYVGCTGTTYSNYVRYGGSDTPTAIIYISSTGKLTTVNQNGTTQSYSFSAGA